MIPSSYSAVLMAHTSICFKGIHRNNNNNNKKLQCSSIGPASFMWKIIPINTSPESVLD